MCRTAEEVLSAACSAFQRLEFCFPSAQPHSPTEFKHTSRVKQPSSTTSSPPPELQRMLADRCVTYSYPTQGSWRGFGPNNTTCRVSLVQLSFNAAYFKRAIKTPLSFASCVIWQAPFKCFWKSDILSCHVTITAEQKLWMENTEENVQGRFLLSFNPSFSISAAHLNVSSSYVSNQPCTTSHVCGNPW